MPEVFMTDKLEPGMFSGLDIHQPRDTELVANLPRHIRETRRNLTAIKVLRVELEAGTQRGDLVFPDRKTGVWLRSHEGMPDRRQFFGVAFPEDSAVIVGSVVICPDWNFEPGTTLYLDEEYGKMSEVPSGLIAGYAVTKNLVVFNIFAQEYTAIISDITEWVLQQKIEITDIMAGIDDLVKQAQDAVDKIGQEVVDAQAILDKINEAFDLIELSAHFKNFRFAFTTTRSYVPGDILTLPYGYYAGRAMLYLAKDGVVWTPVSAYSTIENTGQYSEIGSIEDDILQYDITLRVSLATGDKLDGWIIASNTYFVSDDLAKALEEAKKAAQDAEDAANRAKESADLAQDLADGMFLESGVYNLRAGFYVEQSVTSGTIIDIPVPYYPTRNVLSLYYAGVECIPAHVDPNAQYCYEEVGLDPNSLSTQVKVLFDTEVGQTFSIWVVTSNAGKYIDRMEGIAAAAKGHADNAANSEALAEDAATRADAEATDAAGSADEAEQYLNNMETLFSGLDKVAMSTSNLSRSIGVEKSIARSELPPGQILVVNKTVIYDTAGTQGLYIGDIDLANINVRTISTSPQRSVNPARLGNVDTHADLPSTVSDGQALWNRTALLDDYAHVVSDETISGNPSVDWFVIAIDGNGNITWGSPVIINTSQYQEQSTLSDTGKVLIGGADTGTFGTSIPLATEITSGSGAIATGGVVDTFVNNSLVIAPNNNTGVRRTSFGGIVAHGFSFGATEAENIEAVLLPQVAYRASGTGTLMIKIPSVAAVLATNMLIEILIGNADDTTNIKFFGKAYDTATELRWDYAWADIVVDSNITRLRDIRIARIGHDFYILLRSTEEVVQGSAIFIKNAFAYNGPNVQFSEGWEINDGAELAWEELKNVTINPYANSVAKHANTHSTAGSDPLTPAQIGALAVNGTAVASARIYVGNTVTIPDNATWRAQMGLLPNLSMFSFVGRVSSGVLSGNNVPPEGGYLFTVHRSSGNGLLVIALRREVGYPAYMWACTPDSSYGDTGWDFVNSNLISSVKAYASVKADGTILSSYNVTSVDRQSGGVYGIRSPSITLQSVIIASANHDSQARIACAHCVPTGGSALVRTFTIGPTQAETDFSIIII